MRYHDYHLAGYTVADYGQTIVLNLVWNYPNTNKPNSFIRFSEVALYKFEHPDSAIITFIEEVSLAETIQRQGRQIESWKKAHSVRYCDSDAEAYQLKLESLEMKAWELESAVGFFGFVIAKSVREIEPSASL